MELKIAHLYPEMLNLYGDTGNIITLKERIFKRGIDVKIREYDINEKVDFSDTDIIYIGGGTDREINHTCKKLCESKSEFKSFANDGGTILALASGFPLLGEYYEQGDKKIEALHILDMYTKEHNKRIIGNIILKSELLNSTIVGFENHSGRTYIGSHTPLGKVIYGCGNSDKKDVEGTVFNNVIGSYLHGPLLPKNPLLADYIIRNALLRKYGQSNLEPLDDSMENMAHNYILERFIKKMTPISR